MGLNEAIPWSTTGSFVLGLLGVMGVVALMLVIVKMWRDIFCRRPPLNEELQRREEMLRIDLKSLDVKILQVRQDFDARFNTMQIDRQRTVAELHEKINRVAADVAFIRGKMGGGKP